MGVPPVQHVPSSRDLLLLGTRVHSARVDEQGRGIDSDQCDRYNQHRQANRISRARVLEAGSGGVAMVETGEDEVDEKGSR